MKLLGLECTDLERAKKVLAMLHKLQTIGEECEENKIKVYNASGSEVKDCSYYEGWANGWCEQVYFITMKKGKLYYNWICFVDKDDGYRSYAGLYQFKSKELCLTKNLEQFDLNCSYTENKHIEKAVKNHAYEDKEVYQIHLKVKCKHKVIFECYTDHSDSYYPIGIIHYDLTKLELKYDSVAE